MTIDMPEPIPRVMLQCNKAWVAIDDVEFEGIQENIFGEDVVTFVCPVCKKSHDSKVYVS